MKLKSQGREKKKKKKEKNVINPIVTYLFVQLCDHPLY